jgi:hypothetical protein
MKFYIFFLCLAIQSVFFARAQVYNNAIYTPHNAGSDVTNAVSDMAAWLQKATGKPFQVQAGTATKQASGIWLQSVAQADLTAAQKSQLSKDGQAFYLEVDGAVSVRIVGTGAASFVNGIYTFLHHLGFRWYMPGDVWTIVPRMAQIKSVKRVFTPDFQNRSYAGTGGMNAIPGLDPDNTFRRDFLLWNQRNRLGADFQSRGHRGQVFYNAMKAELDQHPEYFCNGKINRYGRIDISKAAAVQLFTTWAVSDINRQGRIPTIDVDPADGSGGNDDCLPTSMPQIKSWSDKYFWLANKTAQQAAAENKKAPVLLYAYAAHAAPPNFELEKSVYPIIIPYAFQRIADPARFIKMWQQKLNGRPMGIYDYWNITQWSSDIPQFDIYSIPQKLRLWKRSNITSINLESTNAKGPMGHAFWLATQLMWDVDASFEELYQEFLTQCFGPAAPEVKKMYDRWSQNYQGSMEPSLSFEDLAAASLKTRDPLIQKRLSELKAYVYYLKLYYEYQADTSVASYQRLIDYIYGIHYLRLLQTSALANLYIKPPAGYKKPTDKAAIAKATAAIQNIPLDAVEKKVQETLAKGEPTYAISTFRFDLSKARPVANSTKKQHNPQHINGRNNYLFYLATARTLSVKAGANRNTRLIIKDNNGKVWVEKEIAGTNEGYETVQVSLPAGTYTFSFGDYARFSRIVFPEDLVFVSADKFYDNAGYPLLYVYVPKDAAEIVYADEKGPGVNKRGYWIRPDGTRVDPVKIKNNVYRVPVPAAQRGKVWILSMGHRSFELRNIPKYVSLNNFTYTEG